MIDIHCHCLAGLDDGASTLAESLQMLRMAVADGILHVVATAHVEDGVYHNPLSTLREPFKALQSACEQAGLCVTLSLGGEVHVSDRLPELLACCELPVLGQWDGRQVVLLEFPHGSVPAGSLQLLRWLLARDIQPLIAHPERNRDIMRDHRIFNRLHDAGCLLQVTAGSLSGRFGVAAEQAAWYAIEQNLVTMIASDAHNTGPRPPILSLAREQLRLRCGESVAHALTCENAARMLGLPAPACGQATVAAVGR